MSCAERVGHIPLEAEGGEMTQWPSPPVWMSKLTSNTTENNQTEKIPLYKHNERHV